MNFHIEYEREADGRWLAEVPEIPGVLTYGASADEAMAKAEALALRVLAERIEAGRAGLSRLPSNSRLHEPLACCQGQARSGSTSWHRLGDQTPNRLASHAFS